MNDWLDDYENDVADDVQDFLSSIRPENDGITIRDILKDAWKPQLQDYVLPSEPRIINPRAIPTDYDHRAQSATKLILLAAVACVLAVLIRKFT